MEVIAEGIEQASQHEAAVAAGCDGAQGFYYSAPLTAEGLEAWSERGTS
jgi:EAL domain-containing protein (putative c-di-GMP-specific phosphodiesterase class I)